MTSQKIIERLKQKNWFIKVNNDHELALVYNACIDANITWRGGDKIKEHDLLGTGREPNELVKVVLFEKDVKGLTWDSGVIHKEENITNWFFREIKK